MDVLGANAHRSDCDIMKQQKFSYSKSDHKYHDTHQDLVKADAIIKIHPHSSLSSYASIFLA
jgi:hypothetical protein